MNRQQRLDALQIHYYNRDFGERIYEKEGVHFIVQAVSFSNGALIDININIASNAGTKISHVNKVIADTVTPNIFRSIGTHTYKVNVSADYDVEKRDDDADQASYKDIFSVNNVSEGSSVLSPSDDHDFIENKLDNLLTESVTGEEMLSSEEGYSLYPVSITRIHISLARLSRNRAGRYKDEIQIILSKLDCIRRNALLVPRNVDYKCLSHCIALFLEDGDMEPARKLNFNRPCFKKILASVSYLDKLYTDKGFVVNKKNLDRLCELVQRNVFVYTVSVDLTVYKYYSCSQVYPDNPINLFYCPVFSKYNTNLGPTEMDTDCGHFCLITNLYNFTEGKYAQNSETYLCDYCNIIFRSLGKYTDHHDQCKLFHNSDIKRTILNSKLMCSKNPEPILFKDVHMKTPMKCWFVYDFETTQNEFNIHSPVSVGILFFCGSEIWKHCIYSDGSPENVGMYFLNAVNDFRIHAMSILNKYPHINPDAPLPADNVHCGLCEGKLDACVPFTGEMSKTVLHHDHFTGNNICYAHETCNLKEQKSGQITGMALNHNFDIKCFLPYLFRKQKYNDTEFVNNYSVVSKSREKFLSITMSAKNVGKGLYLPKVNFYDALAFLGASLEKSVESLSDSELVYSTRYFEKFTSPLLLKAALKKGFYPYEWMSYAKFTQKELPSIDDFTTSLGGAIKEKDYKQVEIVWSELSKYYGSDMNFEKYNNFYLDQDIYLLADCMVAFRNSSLRAYSLDPIYCPTLPGAAHRCSLLFKQRYGCKPCYTLTDENLYLKFSQTITGGYSAMGKHQNTPGKLLFYLDFAAMYSVALSEYALPYRHRTTFTIDCMSYYKNITDTENYVYFIDADIDYFNDDPVKFAEICHKFRHYLPFPENRVIEKEWLSPYQLEKGTPTKSKKLIMNFFPKNVFVDYRYLEIAERIGCIRIKKINSIEVFDAEKHLAPYVNMTRDMRTAASSDATKNYLKLYNNAVYGRQLVNVLNFEQSKFVPLNNESLIIKQNNHPHFKSFTLIGDEMVMYQKSNPVINLSESIFVGKAVLDISKRMMLEFLYCKMLPAHEKLGLDFELLGTDTDSVFYEVTPTTTITNHLEYYKNIHPLTKCLDFSDFPEGHELHFDDDAELHSKNFEKKPHTLGPEFKPAKKMSITLCPKVKETIDKFKLKHKITGFFNDMVEIKFNSVIRDEKTFYDHCDIPKPARKLQTVDNYNPDIYIGIRSKNYLFVDSKEPGNPLALKGKGVPKHVLKKIAGYEQFRDIVERKNGILKCQFYTLQSKQNKFRLLLQEKIALNSYDDKTCFSDNYSFKYFGSI